MKNTDHQHDNIYNLHQYETTALFFLCFNTTRSLLGTGSLVGLECQLWVDLMLFLKDKVAAG